MNSLLVDTQVWIIFFNNSKNTKEVELLEYFLNEDDNICICPIIYQEILQGIRNDNIFLEIKSYLFNFTMLSNNILEASNLAVDIYRLSRKKGITIRKSNDCLIAAYSILNNIPLLQLDRDFIHISQFTNLTLIKQILENGII